MKKEQPKKLTKKQRKKLKQQELLQKQQEEEQQRELQRIEEQKKREQFLKEKNEKRAVYQNEEKIRLQNQEKQYFSNYVEFSKQKEQVIQKYKQQLEWENYSQVKHQFNIQKISDLNLIIVLLKEKEINNFNDVEELLEQIQQGEEVISNLQEQVIEKKTLRQKEYQNFENIIFEIMKVIKIKVEEICNFLMQNSEEIIENYKEKFKNQNKQKKIKLSDNNKEIYEYFLKDKLKIGIWIMDNDQGGIRHNPVDFSDMNFMSDLPKTLFNTKMYMIVKQFTNNQPLIQKRMIFKINDVQCYKYLEGTTDLGDYKIKQIFDRDEEIEKLKLVYYDSTSNFKIYICLNEEIVILPSDEIFFMYWDEITNNWTEENIKEKNIIQLNNKYYYSVSVPKMAPFSIFTNYDSEFPYHFFKIRRISRNQILFNLETKRNQLVFQISPGLVELVKVSQNCISDLLQVKFSPQKLLLELQKRNIFLLPDYQNLKAIQSIYLKKEELEQYTLKEISKICLQYHIQLSVWNSKVKSESIIMRMRNNPENDEEFHENTDKDWQTVQFKSLKCKLLNLDESSEQFTKERVPNTVSNLNLYFLINENKEYFGVNQYEENYTNDDILLIDTVQKLLQPIHLFALCFQFIILKLFLKFCLIKY